MIMSVNVKFESDLDKILSGSSDMFPTNNVVLENINNTVGEQDQSDVVVHMDIREPLQTLRVLLEKKLNLDLEKYTVWLQDAQMLESHKTLVDQCVEGEGIVQINIELQPLLRRINIVDVLKPTEKSLKFLEKDRFFQEMTAARTLKKYNEQRKPTALQWTMDDSSKFRRDQIKMKIPNDPRQWTNAHVRCWLLWALNEFKLNKINLSEWHLNGKQLCDMPIKEFEARVPVDPGNIFRTHFEILRTCNIVAVLQKKSYVTKVEADNEEEDDDNDDDNEEFPDSKLLHIKYSQKKHVDNKILQLQKKVFDSANLDEENINYLITSRTCSGQIQLWQFLLELLTDYKFRSIIQWINRDGEFRFIDPERVAKLWGLRKSKLSMNYEKLSRALRYYYDGDMIAKVNGKRFVYRFVCDLKQVLGYDAHELSLLINECVEKDNDQKL